MWKMQDVSEQTGLKLIELHLNAEHEIKSGGRGGGSKVEKVRRPEVIIVDLISVMGQESFTIIVTPRAFDFK